MNKEHQEKIKKLIERDRLLRKRKHEYFDAQMIVADMLFILQEIPKWKVWAWYPIARHMDIMGRTHKNCCGFKAD